MSAWILYNPQPLIHHANVSVSRRSLALFCSTDLAGMPNGQHACVDVHMQAPYWAGPIEPHFKKESP